MIQDSASNSATYKRMASHVHIKTAVKPMTEIRRKLRWKGCISTGVMNTSLILTYPQLLRLANSLHVSLIRDSAGLVRLGRAFRDEIRIHLILISRHDGRYFQVCLVGASKYFSYQE